MLTKRINKPYKTFEKLFSGKVFKEFDHAGLIFPAELGRRDKMVRVAGNIFRLLGKPPAEPAHGKVNEKAHALPV